MNDDNLFGGIPVTEALTRAQERKKPGRRGSSNKLNVSAKADRTWEGRVYDSKLEMKMHQLLLQHLDPAQVQCQIRFILQPSYCLDHVREKQRALVYTADFVLGGILGEGDDVRPGPKSMVIDAKGMVMQPFVIGAKLFEYKHRVPVLVVKNAKQMLEKIQTYKTIMNVNQEMFEILNANRPFWILGYRDSSGTVSDMLVAITGRQGYLSLVRSSLEMLEDIEESSEFEPDVWLEAMATVASSLKKKLEDHEEEAAARQTVSKENFTALTPDIMIVDEDPEKLAVLRLEVLETVVVEAGPETAPKKSKPSVLARRYIEKQLPIARYLHRANLYPGKFKGLERYP